MSNKHSDKQKNYLYMQVSNTQVQMYNKKEGYALGFANKSVKGRFESKNAHRKVISASKAVGKLHILFLWISSL